MCNGFLKWLLAGADVTIFLCMKCCAERPYFRHRGRKTNNKQVEYSLGVSVKNTLLCHLQINMGTSYMKLSECIQNNERMGCNAFYCVQEPLTLFSYSYWRERLFRFAFTGYVSENNPYLCDFPMQVGAFNTPSNFLSKYTTDNDIHLNFTEFSISLKLLQYLQKIKSDWDMKHKALILRKCPIFLLFCNITFLLKVGFCDNNLSNTSQTK